MTLDFYGDNSNNNGNGYGSWNGKSILQGTYTPTEMGTLRIRFNRNEVRNWSTLVITALFDSSLVYYMPISEDVNHIMEVTVELPAGNYELTIAEQPGKKKQVTVLPQRRHIWLDRTEMHW